MTMGQMTRVADLVGVDVPFAEELDVCLRCGYCRPVGPTWREVGWESASPRGKAYWLRRIARQTPLDRTMGLRPEVTQRFFEHFYYCTMCGRCAEVCHTAIPLHHVWESCREWLIREGWGPLEPHAAMLTSLATDNNPWGHPAKRRTEWLGNRKPAATGDVLWFVGCSESYTQVQASEAGAKLMDAAGISWTTLGNEEWCCGNAESKIGATEHLDERARHNVDAIEATGATRVVSGCPGCILTLDGTYRDRGMGGDFEVLHMTQYLAELLDEGKLVPSKKPRGKVIWHDPCELGRVGDRIYGAPRRILDAVLGEDNWLEFSHNRDDANCCGGGGAFKGVDDDVAVRIAANKLEEAEELGASVCVTACPTCRFNFNHGVQRVKRERKEADEGRFKMKAIDIKELLVRSL
jgi:heterodisulfide reductase subunit D